MKKAAFAMIPLFTCWIVQDAFASTGLTLLQEELAGWQDESIETLLQTEAIGTDTEFHIADDLFPEEQEADDSHTIDTARDERTASYISIQMGQTLVVLRDVPRTEWFAPYIRTIAEQGIVTGYKDLDGKPLGLFGPADNVTIEQMAKVMLLASGADMTACSGSTLNATASGSWSAPFISCSEKLSWAVYGDGTVDVRRNASRSEVIMTLMQSFGVQPSARTGDSFSDVTLSTQFGSAIEQAKKDGIVSGYTDERGIAIGTFGPEDPVTRAEFSKIVTLGMQVYAK